MNRAWIATHSDVDRAHAKQRTHRVRRILGFVRLKWYLFVCAWDEYGHFVSLCGRIECVSTNPAVVRCSQSYDLLLCYNRLYKFFVYEVYLFIFAWTFHFRCFSFLFSSFFSSIIIINLIRERVRLLNCVYMHTFIIIFLGTYYVRMW